MSIIEQIDLALSHVRHCQVLGMRGAECGDRYVILELPYSELIVGDPETGVIHGGALTTLMDTACGFAVQLGLPRREICPTLDLRIDYMGAARPGLAVFGRAEVYRVTDNVAFARGIAYQGEDQRTIAHCAATFMRMPHNPVPEAMREA